MTTMPRRSHDVCTCITMTYYVCINLIENKNNTNYILHTCVNAQIQQSSRQYQQEAVKNL
jgi:hypothetical protein